MTGPRGLLVLAVAAAALGVSPVASADDPPHVTEEVPRCASVAAQLALARARRSAMRGLAGEAREAARGAAVEGYRAVGRYFATEAAPCAEAAFRAGELLRAGGRTEEALAEFRTARDRGAGTVFRARGELEIGHVHRRSGHLHDALDAYLAVRADAMARSRYRDQAGLWAGRAWMELGHARAARGAWHRVATRGEGPLDRVRAFDLIAQDHLDAGDLAGCAGVLQHCREALADVALEETQLGERVRRALEGMRALERLRVQVRSRCERAADDEIGRSGGSRVRYVLDNALGRMVQSKDLVARPSDIGPVVGPPRFATSGPRGPPRHQRTARLRLA